MCLRPSLLSCNGQVGGKVRVGMHGRGALVGRRHIKVYYLISMMTRQDLTMARASISRPSRSTGASRQHGG